MILDSELPIRVTAVDEVGGGGGGAAGTAAILLKMRALQSAILGSANFSIIATDTTGMIQLFNVGAERMLGYSAADVVGKLTPSDFHDPAEAIERARTLSLELNTVILPGFEALAFKASRGIEDVYELTFVCRDSSRFPAIVSITALRDDYDAIIGYLLIGSHNSVRRQVELELNTAVTVADQANLAKSEFLSSMSHELRTPLNAILGFAQLIETGEPPPTAPQKRSLDQILKAGWYLLDLINEVLDLAQIESGKLSLSVEPISLAEVLRESQSMIESQASARGVRVTIPQLDVPYGIEADRTRLKQILINLLSNAVKFNRQGGTVVVDCFRRDRDRVRVSVTDTGEGLSALQMSQLFQPFNRLGQENRVREGSGLGLVVCKRLVEMMGGQIGVRSTVGRGSVFWIELNLSMEGSRVNGDTSASAIHRVQSVAGAKPKTLLYVEDNPANLMLVEDLIARRSDIRLLTARDGRRGVTVAMERLPDVILMDINLPGMTGVEALRVLAREPRTARIPVIALTANASARDIARGLEAGFFQYLTKPIKVVEFMNALDEALRLAPATATQVAAELHP